MVEPCLFPFPIQHFTSRRRRFVKAANRSINFITVRKLTSKADAFEYADQVLEKWYPNVEKGNNKGIVVLVTSQKEGVVTGGPAFVQAVGESEVDKATDPMKIELEAAKRQDVVCISAVTGNGLQDFCDAVQDKLKESMDNG